MKGRWKLGFDYYFRDMKLKLGSGNSPDLAEYDCKYHSQKVSVHCGMLGI